MPMYYFHLRDNEMIEDVDGTELTDIQAARGHANNVARELMFRNDEMLGEAWSMWSMHVHDSNGLELFSFEMSGVKNGSGQ